MSKIIVSDLFVDILYHMPLTVQVDKIEQLEEEEKYLLVFLSTMNYKDSDDMVIHNLLCLKEHLQNIQLALSGKLSIPFDVDMAKSGMYELDNLITKDKNIITILTEKEIIEHRRNILINKITENE